MDVLFSPIVVGANKAMMSIRVHTSCPHMRETPDMYLGGGSDWVDCASGHCCKGVGGGDQGNGYHRHSLVEKLQCLHGRGHFARGSGIIHTNKVRPWSECPEALSQGKHGHKIWCLCECECVCVCVSDCVYVNVSVVCVHNIHRSIILVCYPGTIRGACQHL